MAGGGLRLALRRRRVAKRPKCLPRRGRHQTSHKQNRAPLSCFTNGIAPVPLPASQYTVKRPACGRPPGTVSLRRVVFSVLRVRCALLPFDPCPFSRRHWRRDVATISRRASAAANGTAVTTTGPGLPLRLRWKKGCVPACRGKQVPAQREQRSKIPALRKILPRNDFYFSCLLWIPGGHITIPERVTPKTLPDLHPRLRDTLLSTRRM